MRRKFILLTIMAMLSLFNVYAQRPMDVLDRGLVAIKVSGGIYCSWRITGEEWYDVKYNLYRDGTLVNPTPLNVSNYTDAAGSISSKYTVKAVVSGVEQDACAPVSVWSGQYLSIPMDNVYIPMVGSNQQKVNGLYELNDASVADLDGDGQYEIIIKRVNGDYTVANDSAFTRFEAYKLNGTKLWQIDCGPNMVSSGNVEVNCMAYDWDCDGKAEVVMRCADGTTLNDGTVIGSATANYRPYISQSANMTYMTQGPEFLILMDGTTGKLLDKIDYPLPRGNVSDWGDSYGHRCNKFFFGAPFLDGRHPSLVLCRGIYSKTIMCAYDISNKKFSKRWENLTDFVTPGTIWYGQGYHNFGIADVDDDGKDEIVYGSMVVDDNGKGLSSTGLGHGDAQHCGDLDPYHKGLEIFACNEANPGANFRDAATSKILWRYTTGSDCGRCMAANVSNDFDGCVLIAGPHFHAATENVDKTWIDQVSQNFELYWDGDLLQETFDYTALKDVTNNGYGTPAIFKCGNSDAIYTMSGAATNNYTKGTPSMQCDIFGDWREEEIVRASDNMSLRIYTTTIPTTHRIYTLLHDMQYRNAIEWQMCGYNQPPHESFYLGEREGILAPPPPVTTNGRTEITTTITQENDGKHLILCNMDGGSVAVSDGVKPYIVTVNSPKDYTLTGSPFTNDMRLVKQGSGNLTYSGTQTYTGKTDLWDGTTTFTGTITKSPIWLNRFAELNLNGTINSSLKEEYGAILHIAGDNTFGKVNIDSLTLKRGAMVNIDLASDSSAFDKNDTLCIKNLTMKGGCVFNFIQHNATGKVKPAPGDYFIGTYEKADFVSDSITVYGLGGLGATLSIENNKIYVHVPSTRNESNISWSGSESSIWDIATTANFTNNGGKDIFISGDDVNFDDNATNCNVVISGSVSPKSVTFDNDKAYTLSGDSIIGATGLVKNGNGTLTITNTNHYTGNTTINAGKVFVTSMANDEGVNYGALGQYGNKLYISGGATFGTGASFKMSNSLIVGEGGCNIAVTSGGVLTMKSPIYASGQIVTKTGGGQLSVAANNTYKCLYINEGSVYDNGDGHAFGDTTIFNGTSGVLNYMNSTGIGSYSNDYTKYKVPELKTGTIYLDGRCNYYGSLVGEGTLNVYARFSRNFLYGDWSAFAGTVNAYNEGSSASFDFKNSYGLPNAVLNVESGCTVHNNGYNFSIGNLSGDGDIDGSGTYTIGARNEKISFNGNINSSNVIKTGDGIWYIGSGQEQTNIGTITINQGRLYITNSFATSTMTGSNIMSIKSDAYLVGRGYCGNSNVTFFKGSTLQPGLNGAVNPNGCITFSGSVVANNSSNVNLNIFNAKNNSTSRSYIVVGGALTLNGNVNITMNSAYTPAAGDSIILWTAKSFYGTPTLNLPELPDGLSWDTSNLLKPTGILRVALTNGVVSIDDNASVKCNAYTTSGVMVGQTECTNGEVNQSIRNMGLAKGTYIIRINSSKNSITRKITVK